MQLSQKISLNFLSILIILIFVGCENTKKIADQKNLTIDKEKSSFEPDDSPPEKEISGYQLVFNDEFNHEGSMKEEYWNAETGFKRNNEHQWYQSKNGICTGGRLIISAKREKIKNPDFNKSSSNWKKNREYATYTSASFITKNTILS